MLHRVLRMPPAGEAKPLDQVRDVMRRKQVAAANPCAAFLVASVTLLLLVQLLKSRIFLSSGMTSGLA
jgi:hypothetical protein